MSKGLRQHIKDHYASESLAPATLEKLCRLSDGDDPSQQSTTGRNRRVRLFAAMCASAAIVALLAIPLSYQLGKSAGQPQVNPANRPRQEFGAQVNPQHVTAQLVAVRLHADWCNRCPQIVPIFERVHREYGMKPVLLVTLDLTDDVHRRQAEQLADAIGIMWVLDQGLKTGTIALVDREAKEILAVLTDPADWPSLASAFGKNLPD